MVAACYLSSGPPHPTTLLGQSQPLLEECAALPRPGPFNLDLGRPSAANRAWTSGSRPPGASVVVVAVRGSLYYPLVAAALLYNLPVVEPRGGRLF